MKSLFCQDEYGQIAPVYSISAGLDYPGIGPEHAQLNETGRAQYVPVTDEEAVEAFEYLSRTEGIIPAIESAHAVDGSMGVRNGITTNIKEMIGHVKKVSDIPCAVGLGIATPQQAQEMAAVSDGAIVGSAIVKLIAQNGKDCIEPVCRYVREMKAAVASASCV